MFLNFYFICFLPVRESFHTRKLKTKMDTPHHELLLYSLNINMINFKIIDFIIAIIEGKLLYKNCWLT